MKKYICFDMDGTIADLYGVKGWLEYLQANNPLPYEQAKPLCNMDKLNQVLTLLSKKGWEICVISWLAKGSNKEYDNKVRIAKQEWIKKYLPCINELHLVKYGTTKANTIRYKNIDYAILFDDNQKVRKGWNMGTAVNPITTDIVKYLEGLR